MASARPESDRSVAVVITTYNHAHYLSQALKSVLAQSITASEIVVVDDGSTDHPDAIVSTFETVRLIRQNNRGLSAARNTGLAAVSSQYVLFLDADDTLRPIAIEAGLSCFDRCPSAAFVYGGHQFVDAEGARLGVPVFHRMSADTFGSLLEGNRIGMHAAVLYRRNTLAGIAGFDAQLKRCEDYDVYLRLARAHPVASHPNIIAEYRIHNANMSHDIASMRKSALRVLDGYRPSFGTERRSSWRKGRRFWSDYYGLEAVKKFKKHHSYRTLKTAVHLAPGRMIMVFARAVAKRVIKRLPARLAFVVQRRLTGTGAPPIGKVKFGDFAATRPISLNFGWDRGLPIDRRYIERFLAVHARDISGRVLEIGDDTYSRQFGADRVDHQDVLHVNNANSGATIVGDLSLPGVLPCEAFDCIVCTQTLHLIFDMPTAVQRLYAALRPGGVLLLTVPGISQIDRGEWKSSWYWSLNRLSVERLLSTVFGPGAISVESYGNVLTATAFLQGLSVADVDQNCLEQADDAYPVIVAARAVRMA